MQARKICHYCQAEPGEFTCQKCGRLVGKNCWKGQICKDCQKGVS